MDFEQVIKNRRSTRQFTDQKIALETIKKVLQEAQLAPSWVNSQPYHIHLAMGDSLEKVRAQQEKFDNSGAKGNPDLPMMSRKDWPTQAQANMAEWTNGLGAAGKEMGPASAKLYNAQAILYLTLPKGYSLWSLYDLGSFGNSIVLAATNQELASMTAYQFIKYPEMLRKELNIADDEEIIIGIGLGYPDDSALINTIKSNRMDLDDILTIHR
ncbi:MAG TPA: nitroreductase [Limosilactobacillus coleohominis]|nr:nitroreductase [Limosilactobacillus coleohominis]